jgi:hypothetical protein
VKAYKNLNGPPLHFEEIKSEYLGEVISWVIYTVIPQSKK